MVSLDYRNIFVLTMALVSTQILLNLGRPLIDILGFISFGTIIYYTEIDQRIWSSYLLERPSDQRNKETILDCSGKIYLLWHLVELILSKGFKVFILLALWVSWWYSDKKSETWLRNGRLFLILLWIWSLYRFWLALIWTTYSNFL